VALCVGEKPCAAMSIIAVETGLPRVRGKPNSAVTSRKVAMIFKLSQPVRSLIACSYQAEKFHME